MADNDRNLMASTVGITCSTAVDALPRGHGTLGRYLLLRVLGHGGFGVVWEAYDPALDRKIAVKLLMPSAAVRGQIVTEAQALARVHHPNVVTVFDAGVQRAGDHELAYVAMELVVGGTLKQWLTAGAPTPADTLDRFLAAARGLEAAHAAGLVHRDFKPSNVLIGDDGRVRVSDFGLAVVEGIAADGGGGASSPLAGTPRYMAPEQLHGVTADARSDQFSFCVSLYEALFGAHPFAADDSSTVELRKKLHQPPIVPPRARRTARIAPIVMRGLAADPSQRWPSMRALIDALERARRSRALMLAAAAGGLALVAGAATVGWQAAAGPPRACRSAADAAVAAAWAPAHQAALGAQFGQLGAHGGEVWRRVAGTLDDWAGRWRALRVEACAAEHDGLRAPAEARARRECLDRRIGELSSLVTALDAPDQTVASYAVRAAWSLTPPESCLAAMPLPDAGAPPARAAAEPVRARIDRAAALSRLDKQKLSLDEARGAADAADKLGWAPLIAEAQLQLARSAQSAIANQANDAFYRALSAAEKVRDDGLRFEAVMGLCKTSLNASDYPLAGRWHDFAAAIASHLPADGVRDARLAFDDMRLALYRGQAKECSAAGTRALALAEKAAPETPLVASILLNLSRCTEDEAAAVAWLKRALALSEKINGHQDSQTANVLTDLGVHERRAGHYDAALADYREALAVREADVGPDNPDCASVHNNISNLLRDRGRYDEARAEIERALDIWTRAWGPESPAVAQGWTNLAHIAMAQGKPAEAEPLFRRALAIVRKKRPPGHPDILDRESMLAQALLAEHKTEALPLFEDALAGAEHDKEASELDRADARFWVARARVELGVHSAGALAMASAACKAVGTSKQHDSAKVCPAWLAAHHAP